MEDKTLQGIFEGLLTEVLALLLFWTFSLLGASYVGARIEDKFNIINREKRNHKSRVKRQYAHNCILRAEIEYGPKQGEAKLSRAIDLFMEEYPMDEEEAFDYLSRVFITTALYHEEVEAELEDELRLEYAEDF